MGGRGSRPSPYRVLFAAVCTHSISIPLIHSTSCHLPHRFDPPADSPTRLSTPLPPPITADPEGGRWAYTLQLLIEDATAQLDALLVGVDAEAFFADLPARDLRADPAAAAELQRRLAVLLGQGCQRCVLLIRWSLAGLSSGWSSRLLVGLGCTACPDLHARSAPPIPTHPPTLHSHPPVCLPTRRQGGPWMELCLKVYFQDPSRPWQTRQYRVYGTRLQLPPPENGVGGA